MKDKDQLNQEKLLEMKEKLIYEQDNNQKNNPKYDPKEFNFQTYSYGEYETGDMIFDDEKDNKKTKNVNLEGLRYPSIDKLLEVVDSKYKLAYIAAKRAKIIKKSCLKIWAGI